LDLSALDNRQNIRILVLFLIVQFAGLLLAAQLYNGAPIQTAQAVQQSSAAGFTSTWTFILVYIGLILIASLLLIFLIRRGSTKILLLFEAFAILGGAFFFFLALISILTSYLPQSLSVNINYIMVLSAVLALALLIAKRKLPRLRNMTSIVASIGIGLALGINIGFGTALLFMFVLAIYDFTAVFITKHMVAMADAAVEMNLALIVLTSEGEALPSKSLTKSQLEISSKQRDSLLKNYGGTMKELGSRGLTPILMPRGLGNGDLAVPLMLATAAYAQFLNFTVPITITIGAAFGLIFTFAILKKYRRALPAIPPLLFGILVALAVYLLLNTLL
jgi:presenilin-like A22 family membrane protease